MNEDFKKIAKGLGVVLPACLLTIGTANAATTMPTRNSDVPSVCVKLNKGNDVISHLMANVTNYLSNNLSPEHTDYHTDAGGNHTDSHSNYSHSDAHTNQAATTRNNQCIPHTDRHTNKEGYNRHTNSGNKQHSNSHTNRDTKREC